MHLIQNKFSFPLEVKFTRRTRSIGFRIRYNKVVISAPMFVSTHVLTEIIHKKSKWIEQKLSDVAIETKQDNMVLFLGKRVSIEDTGDKEVLLKDNVIFLPKNLSKEALLKDWYNIQVRRLIKPRIEEISKKTNLYPKEIAFKYYKGQWGNCNRHKKVTFNILLLMCPWQVIDYVIIHELCHLKEMNHSSKFWLLVKQHCPEYKESIKLLKTFHCNAHLLGLR